LKGINIGHSTAVLSNWKIEKILFSLSVSPSAENAATFPPSTGIVAPVVILRLSQKDKRFRNILNRDFTVKKVSRQIIADRHASSFRRFSNNLPAYKPVRTRSALTALERTPIGPSSNA